MIEQRANRRYMDGVKEFLSLAFAKASINGKITCPCKKCGNGM